MPGIDTLHNGAANSIISRLIHFLLTVEQIDQILGNTKYTFVGGEVIEGKLFRKIRCVECLRDIPKKKKFSTNYFSDETVTEHYRKEHEETFVLMDMAGKIIIWDWESILVKEKVDVAVTSNIIKENYGG